MFIDNYRGGVYEEEDFQPMSYNFKLFNEVSDQRAGGMLKELQDEFLKTLKDTKSKENEAVRQQVSNNASNKEKGLFNSIFNL